MISNAWKLNKKNIYEKQIKNCYKEEFTNGKLYDKHPLTLRDKFYSSEKIKKFRLGTSMGSRQSSNTKK